MQKRIASVVMILSLVVLRVGAESTSFGPCAFEATAATIASRGVKIPVVLTVPTTNGKVPLVVMAHGHGGSKDENGGFTAIATALAARGIASIRMDFPGCGQSTEPFTANNVSNMLADFAAAKAYALANAPIDPAAIGAFGYSMGGRIAILSSADGYRALGLLAPVGTDRSDSMFPFMGGATKYAELAAKAKAQGHVLFTTPFGQVQDLGAKWFQDNEAARGLKAISTFTGPVLFVTGDADNIIPFPVVKATAEAAVSTDKIELVVVKGADHGYGFYGGDPTLKTQTVEAIASFFALSLR